MTHDVCTEWSGQNAADDQVSNVFDVSYPQLDEECRCDGYGDENSAALTEPITLRGA